MWDLLFVDWDSMCFVVISLFFCWGSIIVWDFGCLLRSLVCY